MIKNSINQDDDYQYLKLACYICQKPNHISIECPNFDRLRGNLDQFFDKIKRKDITLTHFLVENRKILKKNARDMNRRETLK